MSKPEGSSKFEQMRSRRHMLNKLPDKPVSKKDVGLIGGMKANKEKPVYKLDSIQNKNLANKTSSAFANNAK
jgi:hypothetical protein